MDLGRSVKAAAVGSVEIEDGCMAAFSKDKRHEDGSIQGKLARV